MKLTYFEGDPPNFGDELNAWIWHELLPPAFLDDDPDTLFLGIGSIIQDIYPKAARKVVVGSGYSGAYSSRPDLHDGTWDVRFVRGPETCRLLGLDPALAIADAAVLLRAVDLPEPATGIGAAFMPHYESVERGDWERVCAAAGVHFLDPTRPTRELLAEIRGARVVVTEAMHGAIVSDALRTPWIAVETMHHVHRSKWYDWGRLARHGASAPSGCFRRTCVNSGRTAPGAGGSGPRARAVFGSPLAAPANTAVRMASARSLARLARAEPRLSDDARIEEATDRALAALDALVSDYRPATSASRA